jgi:hypothetical protein
MNTKYEYEEGDKVYFNIDGKTKGWGYIRGCSGDFATIGKQWIVESERPHPYDTSVYPFSCLSMFSVQIRSEPFELTENPLLETESANEQSSGDTSR